MLQMRKLRSRILWEALQFTDPMLGCTRNSLKLSQCKVSKESFWVFQHPYHIGTSDTSKSSFHCNNQGAQKSMRKGLSNSYLFHFFYLKLHDIIMKNILVTMQGSLLPTPLPFCPLHLLSDSCFWKGFRFILEASQTVPSNSEFSAPSTVPGFFFLFLFFSE